MLKMLTLENEPIVRSAAVFISINGMRMNPVFELLEFISASVRAIYSSTIAFVSRRELDVIEYDGCQNSYDGSVSDSSENEPIDVGIHLGK